MSLVMPTNLVEAAMADGREAWLGELPGLVTGVANRWNLTVGEPFQPGGRSAWVAPARTEAGEERVLKVAWRHHEADHEAAGLRAWDGAGAIRAFRSEELDDTTLLLLERCRPGTQLSARPEPEQDQVIAGLLRRLWIEPSQPNPFRPLQQMCDQWAAGFEQQFASNDAGLDPGLARTGIELFRQLPATADRSVLLCTDLHAANVLRTERDGWLVIDPKPYVGDPTYDALQHMLNCNERLRADPHGLVDRMADLLDLDRARLGLWLFARCVQQAPTWPTPLADVARQVAP